MNKQRGWSLLETLLVMAIVLILVAVCVPLLINGTRTYTIKTPTATFSDTNCYGSGGGMQCDHAYYGGEMVVTVK